MTLKERLENLGYRFLLQYDEGIQYEFNLQKENIQKKNYLTKVLLLIKLILEIKFFKYSPHDKWRKKQSKLSYPEWENKRIQYSKTLLLKGENDVVVIDLWGIVIWSIFGDVNLQNKFIENMLTDMSLSVSISQITCEKEKILRFAVINQKIKSDITKICQNKAKVILVDRYNENVGIVKDFLVNHGFPQEIIVVDEKQFDSWLSEWEKSKKAEHEITYIKNKKDKEKPDKKNIIYLENPDDMGKNYRIYPRYDSVVCAYNAVMNTKMHWHEDKIDYFYGIGYKYGGILVAGICQWLDVLAKQKEIKKIIFLSRDCDIISKVYRQWFNHIDNEYIYVSRRAVAEAFFKEYPKEYVKHVFLPKMGYGEKSITIEDVLKDLEVEFLNEFLKDKELRPEQRLDFSAYKKIIELVEEHYNELLSKFAECREAAIQYFSKKLLVDDRVCVLDLGWKGSTINYLCNFQKRQGVSEYLQGALVGAMEDMEVADKISRGDICTYLFTNERVHSLKKRRGVPYNNFQIKCIETIFSSPESSLTNYVIDKTGEMSFRFRDKNINGEKIARIHKGILDFQEDFLPFIKQYNLHISAENAFAPLNDFLDNRKLVEDFIRRLS